MPKMSDLVEFRSENLTTTSPENLLQNQSKGNLAVPEVVQTLATPSIKKTTSRCPTLSSK